MLHHGPRVEGEVPDGEPEQNHQRELERSEVALAGPPQGDDEPGGDEQPPREHGDDLPVADAAGARSWPRLVSPSASPRAVPLFVDQRSLLCQFHTHLLRRGLSRYHESEARTPSRSAPGLPITARVYGFTTEAQRTRREKGHLEQSEGSGPRSDDGFFACGLRVLCASVVNP